MPIAASRTPMTPRVPATNATIRCGASPAVVASSRGRIDSGAASRDGAARGPSYDNCHLVHVVLPHRQIHERDVVEIEIAVANVPCHTNDQKNGALASRSIEHEVLPNRVLSGPEAPGRSFADDRNIGCAGCILIGEVAPCEKRDAQRREIPRCHDVAAAADGRSWITSLHAGKEAKPEPLTGERQIPRQRHRLHFGELAYALEQLL
jgi:hypothetical protein